MSNQAKLLISALFIVAIILGIGLTRFYFDVSKNTDQSDDDDLIVRIQQENSNGMRVFESTNGLYGVIDAEGSVVIEPQWLEILDVTEDTALVSRRVNGELLVGGLDFDENVVLPFAFRSMERINEGYYIGTVSEDESCIVYDASFEPVFQDSWTSAGYNNGILLLEQDGCSFSYYIGDTKAEPLFRRAEMQCELAGLPLKWSVGNRAFLSELDPEDMFRMNAVVPAYIRMLIENDFSELADISSAEFLPGLSKVDCFPGFVFDEVREFSFSKAENGGVMDYDFAFTLQYHTEVTSDTTAGQVQPAAESANQLEQTVQIHLYFRRNAENELILTSANLDFHNTEILVTEPPTADEG